MNNEKCRDIHSRGEWKIFPRKLIFDFDGNKESVGKCVTLKNVLYITRQHGISDLFLPRKERKKDKIEEEKMMIHVHVYIYILQKVLIKHSHTYVPRWKHHFSFINSGQDERTDRQTDQFVIFIETHMGPQRQMWAKYLFSDFRSPFQWRQLSTKTFTDNAHIR